MSCPLPLWFITQLNYGRTCSVVKLLQVNVINKIARTQLFTAKFSIGTEA